MKDNRQRLFEVMGKIDPTFKPKAELLKEWNFDKKKGEGKEDKDDSEKKDEKEEDKGSEKKKFNFDKKEDKSSEKKKFNFDKKEDKSSETSKDEKEEDKEELKEADILIAPATKKIPVVLWDKVKAGGKQK